MNLKFIIILEICKRVFNITGSRPSVNSVVTYTFRINALLYVIFLLYAWKIEGIIAIKHY